MSLPTYVLVDSDVQKTRKLLEKLWKLHNKAKRLEDEIFSSRTCLQVCDQMSSAYQKTLAKKAKIFEKAQASFFALSPQEQKQVCELMKR